MYNYLDVNTQDSYQLMDEGFIGVIFSVFNDDPNKRVSVCLIFRVIFL